MSNEELMKFLRDRITGKGPGKSGLPTPERRRELREAFRLSQRELASQLETTAASISAWENGKYDPTGELRERYLAFCRNAEKVLEEIAEGNADDKAEG